MALHTWIIRYRREVQALALIVLLVALGTLYSALARPPSEPTSLTISSPILEVLPPHQHDPGDSVLAPQHGVVTYSQVVAAHDMWVNEIDVELTNIPSSVIHHIRIYSRVDDTLCPGNKNTSMYLGLGRDTYSPQKKLPEPYALFIKKGTVIILETALHNPNPPEGTGATYQNVSVHAVLKEMTAGTAIAILNFPLILQDASYCAHGSKTAPEQDTFVVPAHTFGFVKRSATAPDRARLTIPKDGTIVAAGAHTHGWDGGTEMTLYQNGEPIFTWTAKKTGDGVLTGRWTMSGIFAPPLHVHAGDEFTTSARYDNTTDEPVPDAMGIINLYYAPDP